MKKGLFRYVSFLFLMVFISSCNDPDVILPNIVGQAGEVIVVIAPSEWESDLGRKLLEVMEEDYPALPQQEPMFDLVNVSSGAFSSLIQNHRNLIFLDISTEHKSASLKVDRNVYASPQTVLTLISPERKSLIELLDQKKQFIQDLFIDAEKQRIISNYKKFETPGIREKLTKKHKLIMYLPTGYKLDMDTTDFVWISYELPLTSQGIFIYYYDYKDTSDLSLDALLQKRDSVLNQNVAGPRPGSFMTTEYENMQPEFQEFLLNGRYMAEIRGLWRVEGDFMGGPFISLSTVDEKRNRIVTIEGYVYAPKYNKRNYLRQLEAILHTLEFPEDYTGK